MRNPLKHLEAIMPASPSSLLTDASRQQSASPHLNIGHRTSDDVRQHSHNIMHNMYDGRGFGDVTIYVGEKRTPFLLSTHTLRGSSYFSSILHNHSSSAADAPIMVDCEESVFRHIITLLRYGSFEALPHDMPHHEMFKLRKELHFFGIHVPPSPSSSSSPSSPQSGRSSNSNSDDDDDDGVLQSDGRQHIHVDLPEILIDPSKLVLVRFLDETDARGRCPCAPMDMKPSAASEWALSLKHSHAFCTACGRSSAQQIAPKLAAEMFMVAASFYSGCPVNTNRWSVAWDSTCTLKFLSSSHDSALPSCNSCNSMGQQKNSCVEKRNSVWAVSSYYSHAFCTRCGESPHHSSLLSILLLSRFRRPHSSSPKTSNPSRRAAS